MERRTNSSVLAPSSIERRIDLCVRCVGQPVELVQDVIIDSSLKNTCRTCLSNPWS